MAEIAYIYIGEGGNGDFIAGVPARDLTAEEYDRHRTDIDANLASPRPLYAKVEPGQTRDDVMAQPWPGYDQQTVDEIVPRLAELNEAQRARVAEYEQSHRKRKGILDALADLEEED